MRAIGIAAGVAGVPSAVLAFLAAGQWAAFWPAVLGILLIMMGATAFALVWGRDVDLLINAVRHIGADDSGAVAEAESPVLMAGDADGGASAASAGRYVDPGAAAGSGHRARA